MSEHPSKPAPGSGPQPFLWGTATSAHQVEGGNDANDWWDWENHPGRIHDGSRSGAACGWWAGRAEEDLAAAAKRGQNAHRLSVEWSRLEPEPGRFDDAAFDRYRGILEAMGRLGLTAMVTLHHFTLPRWVEARGSFTWSGIVPAFERFAAECGRRLGDRATLFCTMNEPNVLAFLGYVGTEWPPALGHLPSGMRALATMLRAHAAGYRALTRTAPNVPAGIVLNLPDFEPATRSPLDAGIARAQDWAFGGAVLHALHTGELLPPLAITPRKELGLARTFDFLGLNYYGRYAVRFDLGARDRLFGGFDRSKTVHTAHNDWGEIAPQGLTHQLLRLRRYAVPLYVTENGVMDREDALRPAYLRDHVTAVMRAKERGADVRGYFHWSLVDNFEWAEGWSAKFGLIAVDPATQERRPRRSADVYEEICRRGGV